MKIRQCAKLETFTNSSCMETPRLAGILLVKKISSHRSVVKNFIDYMGSLYSADNMTVVVAGGIEEKCGRSVGKIFWTECLKFKTIGASSGQRNTKKPAIFMKQKKTEQIHIAMGVRTVPIDSDEKYPLEVLSAILGGGMSSRLFHEIREKRG